MAYGWIAFPSKAAVPIVVEPLSPLDGRDRVKRRRDRTAQASPAPWQRRRSFMKSTRADCGAFPENAHHWTMDILRRRIAEEFSNSSKVLLDESLRCVIKLHEHGYLKMVFDLVPSSKWSPPEATRH